MRPSGSILEELLKWVLLAPLYAAAITFSLVLIFSSPLMIEMLSDPNYASEGISHLFETLYIWLGVSAMAGAYGFLMAIAPATLTGVVKVIIDRVVENPKYRAWWIYGVAVPVSTLAWFYYLFVFPADFSFTGSHWGRPAYSLMTMFVCMGLVCCWLMLRREWKRRYAGLDISGVASPP